MNRQGRDYLGTFRVEKFRNFLFRRWCILLILGIFMPVVGCQSAYYGTMEAFGVHKRDILVDRVQDARDDQEEAKEQFESALEAFTSVTEFKGGELEEAYDRLNGEYERSKDKAEDVRKRIRSIKSVAEALFDEWEGELDEYTSDDLRRRSEQTLHETQRQYDHLIRVMDTAADKMDPVLDAFHDEVLFLKHNLNAQAIASLEGNTAELQSTISDLVAEMERAIEEADSFIASMNPSDNQ